MFSRALLLAAASLSLMAESYTIGPAEGSRFQLEVEKTGFLRGKKHVFDVEKYEGQLTYDAASPARSSLRLTIEGAGLKCKDTWVSDKDLKKIHHWTYDDMLKIKQYPRLTFTLTQASAIGMGKFAATGTLNVRGVAKPVKVEATVKEVDGNRLRIDGTSMFRMSDYGMKPPTAALGTIGTKDEVVVTFSVLATK